MIYQLIAMFIWASAFIAAKYTYEIMDPVLMVQCRFFIAALIVLPNFFKHYRSIPKHLVKTIWLLAFINFPIGFLLQFIGLYYTSAASAVTMLGMIPLLSVIIGKLFFHQVALKRDLLLSIVAFVGIALTMLGAEEQSNINLWGCLLVLGSAISFCFLLYLSKAVMKEISAQAYSSVTVVLGGILCMPFTLLMVKNWQITPTLQGISSLIYLGLGCTWLAVLLWYKGVPTTPVYISSILTTLEPIIGLLLAILILGDSLTPISALGVVMVLSAMVLSVTLPWLKQKLV